MADPLEGDRKVGQRAQPVEVLPLERVAPYVDPLARGRLEIVLRRGAEAPQERLVAEVVLEAVAAQLREACTVQVAGPPARRPGVERDDDRLETGTLGALHEACCEIAVARC